VVCFECNNQITQALSVGKLSKHHRKELLPTSQVLDIFVAIVLCNDAVKLTSIEERNQLSKNKLILEHKLSE
jgi:hypothetical protein